MIRGELAVQMQKVGKQCCLPLAPGKRLWVTQNAKDSRLQLYEGSIGGAALEEPGMNRVW